MDLCSKNTQKSATKSSNNPYANRPIISVFNVGNDDAPKIYDKSENHIKNVNGLHVNMDYKSQELDSIYHNNKSDDTEFETKLEIADTLENATKSHPTSAGIQLNKNCTPPIRIADRIYSLCCVYNRSENDVEQEKMLQSQFHLYNITTENFGLPGHFTWILENTASKKKWIYPVMIERKDMYDLAASIKNNTFNQQKNWRKNKHCKEIKFIYVIEDKQINDEEQNMVKQALVKTEVIDGCSIYYTNGAVDSMQNISNWTFIIYDKIIKTLQENSKHYFTDDEFFRGQGCIEFELFLSVTNEKSGMTAKELFGRILMCIDGVDGLVAATIIAVYPTLRCLTKAWNECENVEQEQLLLYNNIDYNIGIDDFDLLNVVNAMDKEMYRPVSKKLSEQIWKQFRSYSVSESSR